MKALCWYGTDDVRLARIPEPENPEPTRCDRQGHANGDLRFRPASPDGFIPTMRSGDILGHEFMGEVVEVGGQTTKLKKGDRVVVPFTIACGRCFYDKAKTATFMATDRITALRQAINACRKGGTISIPGVYGGLLDKLPFGAAFHKV
jgi:threonine dehydrogenase-like Zn-dependent dehydrogenase